MPKTLPVRRWHSRQLQARTRSGSRSTVTRSCPQAQVAVRVIVILAERERTLQKRGQPEPPFRRWEENAQMGEPSLPNASGRKKDPHSQENTEAPPTRAPTPALAA